MGKRLNSLFGKEIIEPYGKGVIFLSNLHAHIHAGEAFKTRVSQASVANGGHVYMQIFIPANGVMHLKHLIIYTSGDGINVSFIEEPTVTDGTTDASTRNLNRAYSDDPEGIEIWSDPTGISGGLSLENFPIGGIVGNADAIGAVGTQDEWLLVGGDSGRNYIIDITNTSGTTETMNILGVFYI